MQTNYNFVTMFGLINDEQCLIHNLCVEKHVPKENVFK